MCVTRRCEFKAAFNLNVLWEASLCPANVVKFYSEHLFAFCVPRSFVSNYFCSLNVVKEHIYRPRSRGDNTFGSIHVSVRLSVGALLFEPFDL